MMKPLATALVVGPLEAVSHLIRGDVSGVDVVRTRKTNESSPSRTLRIAPIPLPFVLVAVLVTLAVDATPPFCAHART